MLRPRSACPDCGQQLRARDTIPVLSYVLLGGKCSACRARISPRYPLLELTIAGLYCALAVRIDSLWALPAFGVLVGALVSLSLIDLATLRLPSSIIYSAALLGVPLLVLAALGAHTPRALADCLLAGAIAFVAFFVLFRMIPGAIGFGDVRLAGLCGGFLGWLGLKVALAGFLASFVIGGVVALAVMVTRHGGRKSRLPFGPFLAAGTLIASLFGDVIVRIWLG